MKIIGMIGGMSWQSSCEYYRIINKLVAEKLGGTHSAKCVMVSLDFAEIEQLQNIGDWEKATDMLVASAQQVEKTGADFLLICTNTMHLMADDIEKKIDIPLLHIADATAERIQALGFETVGLLGTRFTMEENFYKGRLKEKYHIQTIIPEEFEIEIVHNVIYQELVLGRINPESKREYLKIISKLANRGAQGIVLGCTEIPLLIKQQDTPVPLFDTTCIHAEFAVNMALEDG